MAGTSIYGRKDFTAPLVIEEGPNQRRLNLGGFLKTGIRNMLGLEPKVDPASIFTAPMPPRVSDAVAVAPTPAAPVNPVAPAPAPVPSVMKSPTGNVMKTQEEIDYNVANPIGDYGAAAQARIAQQGKEWDAYQATLARDAQNATLRKTALEDYETAKKDIASWSESKAQSLGSSDWRFPNQVEAADARIAGASARMAAAAKALGIEQDEQKLNVEQKLQAGKNTTALAGETIKAGSARDVAKISGASHEKVADITGKANIAAHEASAAGTYLAASARAAAAGKDVVEVPDSVAQNAADKVIVDNAALATTPEDKAAVAAARRRLDRRGATATKKINLSHTNTATPAV